MTRNAAVEERESGSTVCQGVSDVSVVAELWWARHCRGGINTISAGGLMLALTMTDVIQYTFALVILKVRLSKKYHGYWPIWNEY
jgi:hypothetical protein